MPKKGEPEISARISTYALGLLASEVDHMFVMVSYPLVGLD
jgi:hypothetical protein